MGQLRQLGHSETVGTVGTLWDSWDTLGHEVLVIHKK